jgi:hypothetical protein
METAIFPCVDYGWHFFYNQKQPRGQTSKYTQIKNQFLLEEYSIY